MEQTAHVYPEGCYFKSLEDIQDKHVTIMGLGLNGGGEASVKFFLRHGAYVTVTDMKGRQELEPTILSITNDPALDRSRLTYVLGQHRLEDFTQADCVIKNPGVKFEGNSYLQAAKAVETDLSIFLSFCRSPIIAVTGSKGKSSTASAICFGLQKAGFSAFLGGNITVSPLTFLEQTDGATPVVLELSSWQLRDLRGRKVLKPKVAVITKILPDHQNWYDGMDSYVADKRLIYADQDSSDFTILDADEDGYRHECAAPKAGCSCWGDDFAGETKGFVLRYSRFVQKRDVWGAFLKKERDGSITGYANLPEELRSRRSVQKGILQEQILRDLDVPGPVNRINALKAALALRLMGVSPEQTCSVLAQWPGLPHRLEACHKWKSGTDGRLLVFYNDSCSTVPESCAMASQSFDQDIILIAGGTDKKLDFRPLAATLNGTDGSKWKARQLYLLEGSGTDRLLPLLDPARVTIVGPFPSLTDLLTELKDRLSAPDAAKTFGPVTRHTPLPVVFSPGCTSFGMFSNEFDRGDTFRATVRDLFI